MQISEFQINIQISNKKYLKLKKFVIDLLIDNICLLVIQA